MGVYWEVNLAGQVVVMFGDGTDRQHLGEYGHIGSTIQKGLGVLTIRPAHCLLSNGVVLEMLFSTCSRASTCAED
jgi:hypothetical protein